MNQYKYEEGKIKEIIPEVIIPQKEIIIGDNKENIIAILNQEKEEAQKYMNKGIKLQENGLVMENNYKNQIAEIEAKIAAIKIIEID